MPLISIITPAYVPSSAYLAETIVGVRNQTLPTGWELEWLVQEDGDAPSLAHHFRSLDFVKYASNGAQLGIAATRNLALSRARGDLVRVLDSDDVLLPDALASLIPHFLLPNVHWATGQADDLMPDGSRIAWESRLPFGVIQAGLVNQVAIDNGGNWPIHCAGLVLRTASVRAVGGWAGLPNDEDVIMFAALSEMADGYNDPNVSWLYRQHPNQATRTVNWKSRSASGRQIAVQRARSVQISGLTLSLSAQAATLEEFESDAESIPSVGPAEKDEPVSLRSSRDK